VTVLEELGADAHVFFRVDARQVTAEALEGKEDATLIADSSALFSARVDPRTRARVGEPIRLAVDPSRFHFFDYQTGASLLTERRPAAVAVAGR
jgi:multiple sugar transport system ATP-binding protein